QLPGAALSRSTAADIATRQAQAIGQLAGQLQGMTAEQARQHALLALQSHRQNLLADQARLAGLGSMLGGFQNIRDLWWDQWAKWFGPGTAGTGLAAAPQVIQQGWPTPPAPLVPTMPAGWRGTSWSAPQGPGPVAMIQL